MAVRWRTPRPVTVDVETFRTRGAVRVPLGRDSLGGLDAAREPGAGAPPSGAVAGPTVAEDFKA